MNSRRAFYSQQAKDVGGKADGTNPAFPLPGTGQVSDRRRGLIRLGQRNERK